MTSLRSLTLQELDNLRSLPDWLGNLGLLQSLCIDDCSQLMCLPTSIQNLCTLKKLRIYGCPKLERRCEKEKGEDWPKIAHIPIIYVDKRSMTSMFAAATTL
ncbi:hypothetical protein RIF29_24346 [Crotalaria pallida]|uniref:Uncharacterized protein n=1 Tax=Crotalaria pallida TaxID=3830 RepID=A0AAN9I358_CROPI